MQVIIREVLKIENDLPIEKLSGFDGVSRESLKHADYLVCFLLTICYPK